MTREEMLKECVTPNEEVFDMCEAHYKQGKADTINSLIELVNSDGFKMRCLMTKLPFFEFVANEFEQVLKEQN